MTTQELIETLQKFPPEATVKNIQNDISGDRFFDVNTVEILLESVLPLQELKL